MGYFMVSYAPTSPFSYLPGLWFTLAGNENVRLAIQAPALASLANESRQADLMRRARSHYSKALAQTNKALSDPQLAVLDGTLLCVLLLSAFEAMAFRGRGSPQSWTVHIKGSVALLNLRGTEQLNSKLGQELFGQVSMYIRTSCAQQSIPVPAEFSRLQNHAGTVFDITSPSYRLGIVLDRFAALRATMRGMLATECVREALYLDGELTKLLKGTDTSLPYKVLTSTEGPVKAYTYKGMVHRYLSQNAARYWNVLRMLRLFLNEWIFSTFNNNPHGIVLDRPEPDSPLFERWDRLAEDAAVEGEGMIDDMLASVPYSLEFLERPSDASARFLIWPLASIGVSALCPMPAMLFVINRLRALGERHEMPHATAAANMIEEGGNMEDWSVFPELLLIYLIFDLGCKPVG